MAQEGTVTAETRSSTTGCAGEHSCKTEGQRRVLHEVYTSERVHLQDGKLGATDT